MLTIQHSRLEPFISTPRLATYRRFFNPDNPVALMGCYLWNKEIASAFFPLLQILEITLRNSIHKEAHNQLGPYWFEHLAFRPTRALTQAQRNAQQRKVDYLHNSIRDARRKIRKDLGLGPNTTVPEDQIIAKVTFGFWTNLFGASFEVNRNPRALWPALLRPVFPNAPQRHRSRSNFQGRLVAIQSFRNKAFHHEPIWNIGRPGTVSDAISNMLVMRSGILEVLRWMSDDSAELVEKAGYSSNIERICSMEYLNYLKYPGANVLPISRARRSLMGIIREPRKTIDITIHGAKVGTLTTDS